MIFFLHNMMFLLDSEQVLGQEIFLLTADRVKDVSDLSNLSFQTIISMEIVFQIASIPSGICEINPVGLGEVPSCIRFPLHLSGHLLVQLFCCVAEPFSPIARVGAPLSFLCPAVQLESALDNLASSLLPACFLTLVSYGHFIFYHLVPRVPVLPSTFIASFSLM